MGRPSKFTPEQDGIILSTTDTAVVNETFVARGWQPASTESIVKRRMYLKAQGAEVAAAPTAERRLPKVAARLRVIESELERVAQRKLDLEEEREEMRRTLQALTQELLGS